MAGEGVVTGPVLESPRIIARPTIAADLDLLYEIEVCSPRAGSYRHAGRTPSPYEFSQRYWEATALTHTLIERETSSVVGSTVLYALDSLSRHARFGMCVSPAVQGAGTAIAGAELVLEYSFQLFDLRRIYLEVAAPNLDQFRSVLRIAQVEGRLVDHTLLFGAYVDMLFLSIRREEWDRRHALRTSFLVETGRQGLR
jgi:RimJ/RimL family protein N-acetyltransferase